jgi:hypothetical protein
MNENQTREEYRQALLQHWELEVAQRSALTPSINSQDYDTLATDTRMARAVLAGLRADPQDSMSLDEFAAYGGVNNPLFNYDYACGESLRQMEVLTHG